jgi:hypothetical protein
LASRTLRAVSAAVAIVVVFALAGYWYWSPFIVIRQMQAAVQAGDAEAFSQHVDYPLLRESLTTQIAEKIGVEAGKAGEAAGGLAASASILGIALVRPLVDALVRPRVVMRAMQAGYLGPKSALPGKPLPQGGDKPDEVSGSGSRPHQRHWAYERIDVDQLFAQAVDPANQQEKPEDRLVLVFQRSGFADWKLTDIRVPALSR